MKLIKYLKGSYFKNRAIGVYCSQPTEITVTIELMSGKILSSHKMTHDKYQAFEHECTTGLTMMDDEIVTRAIAALI